MYVQKQTINLISLQKAIFNFLIYIFVRKKISICFIDSKVSYIFYSQITYQIFRRMWSMFFYFKDLYKKMTRKELEAAKLQNIKDLLKKKDLNGSFLRFTS